MQITTIGLDIAKNVFQVHGIGLPHQIAHRATHRRRAPLTAAAFAVRGMRSELDLTSDSPWDGRSLRSARKFPSF